MAWLNYHHLLYFWTVAREGSVARASAALHLTQPAVSAQIRTLERALGERLFERRGRGLALTETGRVAYRYAEEIFTLGRELQETLAGRPAGHAPRLRVGIVGALPKLVTYRLLEPTLHGDAAVRLQLREDSLERLLGDLAIHALDVVLSDHPVPPTIRIAAYNHLIGDCGVTVFGASALVSAALKRRFPQSLDDAPFLLPAEGTALRRSLDEWFRELDVRPRAVAEIEDSALLKAFGQGGAGLFAAPSAVEAEIRKQYGVQVVGRTDAVRERFYAISPERRIKHPAVQLVTTMARRELFG
ncbi:MAG TPA: transcriptional activator NhaR [Gemmatimonadaceae bacterium]|nr:transcriptional activator NhaR [Gemmatimonadaceae bacterium]